MKVNVWLEELRVRAMSMLGSVLRMMMRESDVCPCCWMDAREEQVLRAECAYCEPIGSCSHCGGACELADLTNVCDDPACESCGYVRDRVGLISDICERCYEGELFAAKQARETEAPAELAEAAA